MEQEMNKNFKKNKPEQFFEQMEQLKEAAYRDSLTGLLNRAAGEIYIQNTLSTMDEYENCVFMIIDLDNFKLVNDTLGHQAGDKLLRRVAALLSEIFRANDIVARLGGDEFMVFLYGDVTKKLAKTKAKAICDNLQLSIGDNTKVSISASVGIYFSKGPSTSFELMYRIADTALYQAKHKGKNQYCLNDNISGPDEEEERHTPGSIKRNRAITGLDNNIAIIDDAKNTNLLYASPAICKMLGLNPKDIGSYSLKDYIHWDDMTAFINIVENPTENRDIFVQLRFKSPTGEWFYTRVSAGTICCTGRCIILNIYNILSMIFNKANPDSAEDKRPTLEGLKNAWEINLPKREIAFYGSDGSFTPAEGKSSYSFPDELISNGWVAREAVDRFLKFATGIYTGRTRGYGNFLIKTRDSADYNWVTLSYRMQSDQHGVPYKVVGKTEPINTDIEVGNTALVHKNALPMAVIEGLIVKLVANVTMDTINRIWVEGSFKHTQEDEKQISFFVVDECKKIYDKGDQRRFINFFRPEHLEKLYNQGEYWRFLNYRRIDNAGYIEWVSMTVNLYKKVSGNDLYLRVGIKNCDDRHIWEGYCAQKDIRSNKTNLYTINALKEIVQGLSAEAINQVCAAVMIRLDGVEQIYNCNNERAAAVRQYVINMLSYALGTQCIATCYDEDKYLYIYPDLRSGESLKKNLEQAFSYSKYLMADIIPVNTLNFFAVVADMQLKEASLEDLIALCAPEVEAQPPVTEDKLVFCGRKSTIISGNRAKDSRFVITPDMVSRQLDNKEQQTVFKCLSDMLLAPTGEKALYSLFKRLGKYYRADRVYLIALEAANRDITVLSEWKLPHLEAIAVALSGTGLEKLQLLTKCILEKKPIGYSYTRPDGGLWNYCVFPVSFDKKTGNVTDFLCLENPELTDYTLVNRLVPYVESKRIKVDMGNEAMATLNKRNYESLPNLHAYMDAVRTFAGASYAGLGIIPIKIPRLAIINSQYGFEYGNRMLRYVTDTVIEVLGDKYFFRTWDNEFVVLIPNVVKALVEDKYKWLKNVFERRYGKDIHISYRWAEESFTVSELMNMAKVGVNSSVADIGQYARSAYINSKITAKVPHKELNYKFVPYVQPIFEIKTHRLAGAELLARGIDNKGAIVQPYRFLKIMEVNKTIKHLDLFILDKAFSIVDKCRANGLADIPLGVNFSKVTMLDNSLLASYLAVRSRYPHLNDYNICIELSQSIFDEDSSRLVEAMDSLREFGTTFTMDDVGVDIEGANILGRIKVEAVKIDPTLIMDTGLSENTREVVRALTAICAKNKLACVAEGVETKQQLTVVRHLGCTYAQGLCYDKPMTLERFTNKYLVK